jgi:hypothetical protein
MHVRIIRMRVGVAIIAAAAIAVAAGHRGPLHAAPADVARYHTYQELSAALKAAAAAHPDLARLVSIGRTKEGRDLWAVEIASLKGTPLDSRPALLVAANLEADHVIGSELALYAVDYLLGAYPADAAVKQRLDSSVIYVLPRVNPDGAELMFAPVKALRRTNATAFDADNDARVDEDGPEDLNKDGVITVMRVKDPKGAYMISPEDARLMKRADPAKGESGGWSIYPEGIDNDGDGFINEDGPGGVDINRNFMHQYPYFGADAGRYMVSETETRAVLDFVLKHRNIAAILTFGESDNLIAGPTRPGAAAGINLVDFAERSFADARRVGMVPEMGGAFGRGFGRGGAMSDEGMSPGGPGGRGAQAAVPGAGGRGMRTVQTVTTVNPADVEYLNAIATKYRELTGLRSAGYTRAPAGAFYEYGYYQFGVPSFSTPGWGLPGGARPFGGGAPPGDAAGRMGGAPMGSGTGAPAAAMAAGFGQRAGGRGAGSAAADADAAAEGIDLRLLQWMDVEKIDGFVNWTPFRHPTLGDVEIGGFKPYVTVNPPAARIAELGAGHAKFVVYLSSIFSNVKIARTDVAALGGGLFRIKADVENTGFLPTALAHAAAARSVKPVMVQLGVPPESIITGAEKTSAIQALAGAGSTQSFEWVIKGQPGASVILTVQSQKSGSDRATIALR